MYNFYSNDLEIILSIVLISVFINLIFYNIKNYGKLYLNIFKMRINIINKNTSWNEQVKEINENTKYVELDFIFQIYNNRNSYNSIYNLDIYKKVKGKFVLIENHNLNLTDSMKSITGSTTYEKIKFINILPYEVKEYRLKIKLTKEEYEKIKKEPIYLRYKNRRKDKKLKINKYLKSDKSK